MRSLNPHRSLSQKIGVIPGMQHTLILVLGGLNRKAPMVAEMAPEAPIDGTATGLTRLGCFAKTSGFSLRSTCSTCSTTRYSALARNLLIAMTRTFWCLGAPSARESLC